MSKQFVVELVESEDGSYPDLTCVEGDYMSYFENGYGEQLIFVYRNSTKTATLYHSDYDWEPVEVTNGLTPEMVTNAQERLWLGACWWAAIHEQPTWLTLEGT